LHAPPARSPTRLVSLLRSDVARIEGVVMRDALEVRRVVGIAAPNIFVALRLGAERSLERHRRRSRTREMCRDDLVGSNSLLHPLLEGLH
jgi:hypothetical protein